ncbi:unnamed protein product, partial [Rotaria sordida]
MILGIFFRYADNYPDKAIVDIFQISSIISEKKNNTDIQSSQDYIKNTFNEIDKELSIHWLRIIKHYIRVPLDNRYGSHQLVLLATSILTSGGGPVLGLG